MVKTGSKVLIITNRPSPGGVQIMLRFVIDCLIHRDCDITLAYYQPYSVSPTLSVPLHRLLISKPAFVDDSFYGHKTRGLGCWLPELEVSHYFKTKNWSSLIEAHDVHVVVSGSCLPALCLLQSEKKFLAWIASDWQGDRRHRVKQLSIVRRLLDFLLISPLARRIERRIVRSGQLLALSQATKAVLNRLSGDEYVKDTVGVPINTELFHPSNEREKGHTLGFVGRFEDPRKHITLLFEVLAMLVTDYPEIKLLLVGDKLSKDSQKFLRSRQLEHRVEVIEHVEQADLPYLLQQMNVFVLPSHQEGLCIALLEAMSCGLPVVSTRCGGPESFVVDDENGRLCEHNAAHLGLAISQIFSDEKLRMRYASAARMTIIEQFSVAAMQAKFWLEIDKKYVD